MKTNHKKQYTIRNVTPLVDQRLRQRSQMEGKSLNEVALEALERGVGVTGEPMIHTDLDALIGTWKDDPVFDEVIRQQDSIDPKIWS